MGKRVRLAGLLILVLLVVVGTLLMTAGEGGASGSTGLAPLEGRAGSEGASPKDLARDSPAVDLPVEADARRARGLDLPLGLACEDRAGEPIVHAHVRVDRNSVGFTDADGQIPVRLLPVGTPGNPVVVEVDHPDYLPFRGYLALPLQGRVIRLSSELGLTVQVWDGARRPVADAQVQVRGEPSFAEGWTGPGGRLELSGLEPGQVGLLVSAPGFVGRWRSVELDGEEREVEVVLRRGREFEVQVVDTGDVPVAGVQVAAYHMRVSNLHPPIPALIATTNANGIALFDGLPEGRLGLTLTIRDPGFTGSLVNVSLPDGELLGPIEFVVHPTARLHVTCELPDGTRIAASLRVVELGRPGGGFRELPSKVAAGTDGVELTGLPSGVPLGLAASVDQARVGILIVEPLAPGEQRPVVIETLALGPLRLRMVDGAGGPVEGSFRARAVGRWPSVSYPDAWPRGERVRGWRSRAECAADGTAVLWLPPGRFEIRALGTDSAVGEQRVLSVPTGGEELFLVARQRARSGRLVDGEGRPLGNWGIEASGYRGAAHRTITGPEGRFDFPGPSGDQLRVLAVHPCGLTVELFDGREQDWPRDGTFTVELHRVRVSVVDLRSGSSVAFRLRVRSGWSGREPIDPLLGFFAPSSDRNQAVTMRLPAGETYFVPSSLRPGPEVVPRGGDYRVFGNTREEIRGDRELVLLATHGAEAWFADSWPVDTGGVNLQWTVSVEGRRLNGLLHYPPLPFGSGLIPIGEVELKAPIARPFWPVPRTVEISPEGRIPY
jgi:hypothetical protein